ncbi:hypothetical protein ACFVH6_25710 [Spirillospora sp. NPDC127200]
MEQLPIHSAFLTAVRGGNDYVGWDRSAYMTADLIDSIQALTHIYISAHSKKTPKPPEPYPRPGQDKVGKEVQPNPLLARLRGEDEPATEVGPGSAIPLPPR